MADFKTHVTTSSLLGIGLGAGTYFAMDFPLDQSILGAGLCGIAGMLPDLESPNSVPVRETIALAAAIVPMLMLEHFHHFGMNGDQIVLFSALIYFGIRFGIGEIFKRYTVHRGMWHSVPAALSASLIVMLLCSCDVLQYRVFKAVAVFIGFISHLVLDEIYSIDLSGKRIRVKSSSGTALKFWSGNSFANFSCYTKLVLLTSILLFDPMIMNAIGYPPLRVPAAAKNWIQQITHPHTGDPQPVNPLEQPLIQPAEFESPTAEPSIEKVTRPPDNSILR